METKEIISDFKESFFERIRNPFVLTYAISWFAWNWLFVYELFSFPTEYSLPRRIGIVNNYVQAHIWDNLTFFPLWSAAVSAVIYLCCSAGFLMLFSLYQRTIKPIIYSVSAQDENIPRYLYNALQRRHDTLKKDFDASKKLWNDIEESKKETDSKLITLETSNTKLTADLAKTEEKYEKARKELNKYNLQQTESIQIFQQMFVNGKFWYFLYEEGQTQNNLTYNELRFHEDNTVRTKGNAIQYQLSDIIVSPNNQVIQFQLKNHNDLQARKTQYLFVIGDGSFRGFEIAQNSRKTPIGYYPHLPKSLNPATF